MLLMFHKMHFFFKVKYILDNKRDLEILRLKWIPVYTIYLSSLFPSSDFAKHLTYLKLEINWLFSQ